MDLFPTQPNYSIPPNTHQQPPRVKSFLQIMLITINLSLSNFYFGYCLVYISTVQFKEIIRIFDITMSPDSAKGILLVCIPVGAGVGALLGRKLIHVFSRRKFVLFINFLAIVAGGVIFINNMFVFIIMRLIQGICVGMYTSIVPLYINEISPVEIESSTTPFTQIFCSCGTTVAYLFYFILNISISDSQNYQDLIWYLVLGFPLIPLIVQTIVLLFVFPYETPKYLLLHHHKRKARQLIEKFYKPEYVETVFHQKIEDLEQNKGKQALKASMKAAKEAGLPAPTIRLASKVSLSSGSMSGVQIDQPETPPIAIFAAIHLMILRQFSGINAVVAYGGDIISQASSGLRAIVPVFLNFQIMLGAIVAICILHRVGRKTLLQTGTTILALSLVIITIGFFILDTQHTAAFVMILLGLIVFTFFFGLTYGAIIWAYVSEIVEPSYDILATMITWIFASIVIILFPILKSSLLGGNPAVLFLFFCIWVSVSFFVNKKILIETRNKNQHEIREEYMKMNCGSLSFWKKKSGTNETTQNQPVGLNRNNDANETNGIELKMTKVIKPQQKHVEDNRANPHINTTFDILNGYTIEPNNNLQGLKDNKNRNSILGQPSTK